MDKGLCFPTREDWLEMSNNFKEANKDTFERFKEASRNKDKEPLKFLNPSIAWLIVNDFI